MHTSTSRTEILDKRSKSFCCSSSFYDEDCAKGNKITEGAGGGGCSPDNTSNVRIIFFFNLKNQEQFKLFVRASPQRKNNGYTENANIQNKNIKLSVVTSLSPGVKYGSPS